MTTPKDKVVVVPSNIWKAIVFGLTITFGNVTALTLFVFSIAPSDILRWLEIIDTPPVYNGGMLFPPTYKRLIDICYLIIVGLVYLWGLIGFIGSRIIYYVNNNALLIKLRKRHPLLLSTPMLVMYTLAVFSVVNCVFHLLGNFHYYMYYNFGIIPYYKFSMNYQTYLVALAGLVLLLLFLVPVFLVICIGSYSYYMTRPTSIEPAAAPETQKV